MTRYSVPSCYAMEGTFQQLLPSFSFLKTNEAINDTWIAERPLSGQISSIYLCQSRFDGSLQSLNIVMLSSILRIKTRPPLSRQQRAEGRQAVACTPYCTSSAMHQNRRNSKIITQSWNTHNTFLPRERLRRFEIICAVNSTSSGHTALNWVTNISGSALKKSF